MKKYYAQVIIGSFLIGLIVRLVNQWLMGLPIEITFDSSINSVFIGVFSGIATMYIYTRFLISSKWSRLLKFLVSYGVIILIYFIINVLYEGITYLVDPHAYLIAAVIVILATPIILAIEKNTRIFNEGLERVKLKNRMRK
ncbi:hypothetical protein HZI73_07375 [Vallitalea pronyensis]|uniref:Uncharacterized protein n=1 Tax=Vallitalea pronyensis TaxID=1348613 RepID=A0A8J8MIH1_9FIRM|nr:hypothetical protein [Vallitalea pronyensis]QUI22131.1 hypothetical protein HZI73_07375 [Vallitalea pronyensis]